MQFRKLVVFQFLLIAAITVTTAMGQDRASQQQWSPLDGRSYGVVYDVPATRDVKLIADVPYLSDARGKLTLDIYQPPGLKAGETRPAVVFLNAIGDQPGNKLKSWGIYTSWPRLIAAHGLIGVSMEADATRIQESLRGVFNFLADQGAKHGVDGSRVGVYAASANVRGASEYLMGDSASKGIRAAVLYYGNPPQTRLRNDLPVLFVIAESDASGQGQHLTALWQRVFEARAPWSLTFASRMPHAFDAFADNDESRRIVRQTIEFWRSHLEPVPQPSWSHSEARDIVAAVYGNNRQKVAELLPKWIAEHPGDTTALALYANTLRQMQRLDEAASVYERAMALGSTDAGVALGLGQVRLAQQRWADAAQLLSRAIDSGARNSLAYGQLAYAQLHLNRNEDAIKNYEKAFEAGIPPGANSRGIAYFNMACGYARLNQKEKAIESLSKAIDEGFTNRNAYETDTDLAPLRSDARFQELLARLPKS